MAALFRNSSVRLPVIADAFSRLQLQHTRSSFVQWSPFQLRSISQTRPSLLNKLAGANLTTASDHEPKPTTTSISSIATPHQLTQLPLPAQAIGAQRKLRTHTRSFKGKSRWTTEEDILLFRLAKEGMDIYDIYAQHFSRHSFGAVSRRVYDAHKMAMVLERQVRDGVQPGEIDVGKSVAGDVGAVPLRTVYCKFRVAQSLKAEQWKEVKDDEAVQESTVRRRPKERKGAWTTEEDVMLEQLVERYDYLPEPALWYRVAGGNINGSPLLRDATSCGHRWRRLHPTETDQIGLWTSEEERRLQEAIWEQLEGKYQVAVDVFPNKPATTTHNISAWRPELVQLPGQEGLPILKDGSRRLLNLNWLVIAEKVKSRPEMTCRNHFYSVYHNASRGPWTTEENARGKEGLKMFGTDYQRITAHIGTRSRDQVTKMVCYWESKRRKREAKAATASKDTKSEGARTVKDE